jgi:DeoR family transcriptional regulator of aga operon
MAVIERRNQIRRLLGERQQISIHEISRRFEVSVATARRDLDALASQGRVERIRGGAQMIQKAPPEMPIAQRSNEQIEEKAQIAKATVRLIKAGETLFLGSGTTVMGVAKLLPVNLNLTVVTNSLFVANVLAERLDVSLIILGGTFRHSEYSIYGHLVELALGEINCDRVIFGIRAISLENGLTNDFLPEVPTDRSILKASKEVIIVADHTKFNRVSTARVCPISWVQKIVTDKRTPQKIVDAIAERGVDVIVA